MSTEQTGKANFGTAAVFLTSISTILGAILFLRFGYAVGNVGFIGVLFIIGLGHLVTIPTAFAIAEISTNQRVQGGGEYYIISRSFGVIVGSAIGISLFLSRAISVAFYVIALTEAFDPALSFANESWGWPILDKRVIGLLAQTRPIQHRSRGHLPDEPPAPSVSAEVAKTRDRQLAPIRGLYLPSFL